MWRDNLQEIDNSDNPLSTFFPLSSNFVSKIPWEEFQIFFLIFLEDFPQVSEIPPHFSAVCQTPEGKGVFDVLP